MANSFLGVLGDAPFDGFNPDLLRDEPLDRVRAVIKEAQRIHGLLFEETPAAPERKAA